MEQDGRSLPPQLEAKREHPFPLTGCSNFKVSYMHEDERSLCWLQRVVMGDIFLKEMSQKMKNEKNIKTKNLKKKQTNPNFFF